MNYRHAYHAGNFADVLKHTVLALVIEHLKQKPAPFRVIDTHAGTGEYDLHGVEASKTGEWREGIARVIATAKSAEVAALLAPYLTAIGAADGTGVPQHYPGSPLLARRLLRPEDRLIVNELHPEDAAALAALFARDKQAKVSTLDGWTALKAFLPPKERRGVVLIDPPFEQPGELDRLVQALEDAVRRFATGIVLLWYPIKATAPIAAFERRLADLSVEKMLRVELMIRSGSDPSLLNGTGLIVLNPPYTLVDKLKILMPYFAATLSVDGKPSWRLDWLTA